MEQIRHVLKTMISVLDEELKSFEKLAIVKKY